MSIGGYIRRTTYWIKDYANNQPVGKHIIDIRRILKNKDNVGFILQKKHLYELITYAVKNSDFYKKFEGHSLESFPVIDKNFIRDNYISMLVDQSIIPEHSGKMHVQRTSGSTGIPLAVPQDKRKRNRRIAELKYFGRIAGYKSHEKLAHLRIWTKWQNKTKLQTFKENIFAVDCSIINDEMLSSLCNLINKKRIKAIWGYASWYDQLSEYIEKNAIKLPSLKVVIAGSEMLKIETRENLKNC